MGDLSALGRGAGEVTFYPLGDFSVSDNRGWVVNVLRAAGLAGLAPANVHLVSLEPGAVRGNHWHEEATEWLFIFGGVFRFEYSPLARYRENPEDVTVRVVEHAHMLCAVGPRTYHAIRNIGRQTMYLLAFNNAPEGKTITRRDE